MIIVLPKPQIDRNTTAIYAIGETHPTNLLTETVNMLLREARQLPKHAKEECLNSLDSLVSMHNLGLLIRKHTGCRMDTDSCVWSRDLVGIYWGELTKFAQRKDITEITRNKMLGHMQIIRNMVGIEQKLIQFVQPNIIYHEGFAGDIYAFLEPNASCVPLDKNARTEYEKVSFLYHFSTDRSVVKEIEQRREGLWFEAIKESPPTGPCLLIAGATHFLASTKPDNTGNGTLPRRIKEAGIKFELLFDASTSPYTRLPD